MISKIKSRIKRVDDWSGITGWILASIFTVYFLFNVNLVDFGWLVLFCVFMGSLLFVFGVGIVFPFCCIYKGIQSFRLFKEHEDTEDLIYGMLSVIPIVIYWVVVDNIIFT